MKKLSAMLWQLANQVCSKTSR